MIQSFVADDPDMACNPQKLYTFVAKTESISLGLCKKNERRCGSAENIGNGRVEDQKQ